MRLMQLNSLSLKLSAAASLDSYSHNKKMNIEFTVRTHFVGEQIPKVKGYERTQ